MSVNDILKYAFDKFDANEYDEAVMAFMAAHQASDDPQQKDDIFQVINESFIAPNENEFKKAYEDNTKFLLEKGKLHLDTIPEYGMLSLKMIPASDSRFYVWNDEESRFEGKQPVIIDENKLDDVSNRVFSPMLIDGYSDMRLILHDAESSRNMRIYMVLKNDRMLKQFFSYLTIPGMGKILCELNVDIFDDKYTFEKYIRESGAYIPRRIKSEELDEYTQLMTDIHNERVSSTRKGDNVFLSICIPSWNRGKEALETVKNLQQLMYDEEIEIVLCNNSSTKQTDYYEKINELASLDKRIVYKELPSTCYRDSFENVIGLPSGKYAIFSSDQDHMITENFDDAIQYIYNNSNNNVGVMTFETISPISKVIYYRCDKSIVHTKTMEKVALACGSNYITGLCFNMDNIRKNGLLEKIKKKYHENADNKMYDDYTHCVLAAYLVKNSEYAFSGMPLFEDEAEEESLYLDNGEFRLKYIFPENRMISIRNETAVLIDLELEPSDLAFCILNTFANVYRLLRIGYSFYPEIMLEKHSWEETCEIVLNTQKEIIDDTKVIEYIGNDDLRKLMEDNIEAYYLRELANKKIT
ncbi:glycosyltransferase [Butyrivibrio sp. MB2005]|uniref:glycosyltransferase n=1 Tax=Butyrivibrio sp. MB2005 TaxID=1280678 RepID=UPI00041F2C97|nr:glycosyltransferase [Butyrivibrio sp. MB2005]